MKTTAVSILILTATLVSTLGVAQAATLKIECAQDSKNVINRADSVAKMVYIVDTQTNKGSLSCAEKIQDSFCGSMRMDLSKFTGASVLDNRLTVNFFLVQEDEVDNFVSLSLYRNQKVVNGTEVSAVITDNPSGELPTGATVVSCKIK